MENLMNTSRRRALIALGANLPRGAADPAETLGKALTELAFLMQEMPLVSRFWRTPAFPAGSGPDYVNAAASVFIPPEMTAAAFLALLHGIESGLGRQRGERWAGRVVDLDLLALEAEVVPDAATQDHWRALPFEDQSRIAPDGLILPHPRMQDRAFVLVPLAEIAPDWRHPRLGLSVAEMLALLPVPDREAVIPLEAGGDPALSSGKFRPR